MAFLHISAPTRADNESPGAGNTKKTRYDSYQRLPFSVKQPKLLIPHLLPTPCCHTPLIHRWIMYTEGQAMPDRRKKMDQMLCKLPEILPPSLTETPCLMKGQDGHQEYRLQRLEDEREQKEGTKDYLTTTDSDTGP